MASQELQRVEATYRRLARRWVWNAVSLVGFQGRESLVRRRVVAALRLQPGDAVLDVACGRGANLPYLVGAVGPQGRIVGVDYSPVMLAGAEELVRRKGWANVQLLRADAAEMEYRSEFQGAVCTFGLTVIPRWREALRRMVAALRPRGRVAVLDARLGEGVNRVWNPYLRLWGRITAGDLARNIPGEFRKLLSDVEEEALYLGTVYIVSAAAPETEVMRHVPARR